jgi:hypothetical protein
MHAALDAPARCALPARVTLEPIARARLEAIHRLRDSHRDAPLPYAHWPGQQ